MSVNFSCNQYEQEFDPKRLQNWEVPGPKGKYPERREGFSKIHANSRGHLLPNVPRNRSSPWGTFVGTWDMPLKIPGNRQLNPTARSEDVQVKMQTRKEAADEIINGQLKPCKIPSPLPMRITDEDKVPISNNAIRIDPETAAILAQTTLATKGSDSPPNLGADLNWPRQGGTMESPVGHPASPKPVTPMNLGGEAVQREARNHVSPVNPEQVAVSGAVATPPVEFVGEGMRTPGAVDWPMAKSPGPQVDLA